MAEHHLRRLEKLRGAFPKNAIDAFLVTNVINVRYLSGFKGDDSWLLITPGKQYFLTDGRYTTQAKEEAGDFTIVTHRKGLAAELRKIAGDKNVRRLGIESTDMKVFLFDALVERLKKIKLVPLPGAVETIRKVKGPEEIEAIKTAIVTGEEALRRVLPKVRPGWTEKKVYFELEHAARKLGADCLSFPPIIGFAERGALPHGTASDRVLAPGEPVLIDWGVARAGYNSDLTRCFATGRMKGKLRDLYKVLLEAQEAAFEVIRPGVPISEVEKAARRIVRKAGFNKEFNHSLGHGVGMEVHEAPGISTASRDVLVPGYVFTVEPGVYFPGEFGLRAEDMVLVTDTGMEILSSFDRKYAYLGEKAATKRPEAPKR